MNPIRSQIQFAAAGQTFTLTPTFDLAARLEEILGGVGVQVLLQQANAGVWQTARVGRCVVECLMACDNPPTDRKTAEALVMESGVVRFLFDENGEKLGPLLQVVTALTYGPAALAADNDAGDVPAKKQAAPK